MIKSGKLARKQIFDFFKKRFERKGFNPNEGLFQFKKDNLAGFDTVIISLSEYDSDFLIEFHLGKRIDKVEKFASAYLDYPSDFSNYSMTIVCSFARLNSRKFQRFTISNYEDLKKIAEEMDDFLNKRGFRVLEQWSSLTNLNSVYNEDPYSMNMFYNPFTKAVRGTIINKFIGDERYELLQQVYKSILHKNGVPERSIQEYQRLSSFLNIYSPN